LLKALPILQKQLDALLEFEVSFFFSNFRIQEEKKAFRIKK
jgi:hypothetical protein